MIPFNKPYLSGQELVYLSSAYKKSQLAGGGSFTKKCCSWLESYTGCTKALLTHSCTAALEMAAILINTQPGDEIIMPSYTFVSTANAFVMRGAIPRFIDIRPDTLNMNEELIEEAINDRTKAIVAMHYSGVACEMDAIIEIAKKYNLFVIEDSAHGIFSSYNNKPLGSIGDLGCFSFHETKNIISGEGGALIINNPIFKNRAEIILEKGTNRNQFLSGLTNKYTWVDIGSSYLPSDLIAALLWAQIQNVEFITSQRKFAWKLYHQKLEDLELKGLIRRPVIPFGCNDNAHMYYIVLNKDIDREEFIERMEMEFVQVAFHYVPLHSAPAISSLGLNQYQKSLPFTEDISSQLVRLPMWVGVDKEVIQVTDKVKSVIQSL